MAAIVKQLNTSEAAAAELWQVAETGDVAELLLLLPRVGNVNVSNRHGMTALMKAAFHGHEPMVRALLEHGADPNLMRNDRFTALALAAFFGHTETVKTLIEHGARAEVKTRCGASARTWATARTFSEVAKCIEMHAPLRVTHAPAPVPYAPVPVERKPLAPVTVKTLKEPPEIWDLVHEVPRNFDARSAFFSRIATMKRTSALGVLAGLILLVCCGAGALVLRSSRAHDQVMTAIPPHPSAAAPVVSESVPQQAVTENPPVEVVNGNHASTVPNKARMLIRQPRSVSSQISPQAQEAAQRTETPMVASPQFESPKPAQSPVKSSPVNPLSPNVISPAKNAPPKGKVIQWP